ncbi:radical SAM protein [bacterium]|nr:radical SAM protein [bacterium]
MNPPIRLGLVSPATYNQSTDAPNKGPTSLLMQLTWPSVTAFLNDSPDVDRYQYQMYDDVTDGDISCLKDVDAVLFTAYTGHIYRARELARQLRAVAGKRQRFILGGIHVTSVVFETIRAFLYKHLADHPEAQSQLTAVTDSRVVPLHRLVHRLTPFLEPALKEELLRDSWAFFMERGGPGSLEQMFDQDPLPGHSYAREFFELNQEFDVLFAGLIDGKSPLQTSVRARLLEAIEADEPPAKAILSLGFGSVDEVPRPNWKLCLGDRARKLFPSPVSSAASGRRTPVLAYETGRGCQHACDFCSVVNFFGPLTYRNPSVVYEELRQAIVELGCHEFFFVDDNLNGSIKRFTELCQALVPLRKEFPTFGWACQLTFEHVAGQRELMQLASRAGMNSCYLGLEGVDTKAFEIINKAHNTRENVREGLQILKEEGIVAFCNVIMGLPTDDEKFPAAMLAGLKELDVPAIVPFTCSVLPGTALFNQLHQARNQDMENIVKSGWKYNNSFDVVMGTSSLDKDRFAEVKREFVRRYAAYERMLSTCSSYYKSPPWNLTPSRWIASIGDFVQVVAFNIFVSESLARGQHYMACGPHYLHAPTFLNLARDAAWRKERGLGWLRAGLLTLLSWLLPFLKGPVNRVAQSHGIDLTWDRPEHPNPGPE